MNYTKEEVISELANGLKNSSYIIPLISDDMFIVEHEGKKTPLLSFIVDCFAKDNPNSITEDELRIMKESGYYGLTLLSQKYSKRYIPRYQGYIQKYRNNIKLKPTIKEFLNIVKSPLIITTSAFEIIEKELDEHYKSMWYTIEKSDNTPIDGSTPVVYHLFGNGEEVATDWVSNEKSLLKFLHFLHDSKYNPENLANYINKKCLLILGGLIPNWIFRFMWYPLISEDASRYPTGERGAGGYWLSSYDDDNFDNFLNQICFASVPEMEDVISEVTALIKKGRASVTDDNSQKPYDIFISYASHDEKTAINIKNYLQEKHKLRVWFDNSTGRVKEGGNYWTRIENGLKTSRYIMPIVTTQFLQRFLMCSTLGKEPEGLVKEINMAKEWFDNSERAQNRDNVYSLPIIINNETDIQTLNELAQKEIIPSELFKDIQCYFYFNDSKNSSETFRNHDWGQYKIK